MVGACEDMPGNKRLVAYIILKAEMSASTDELRCWLQQKLPDYMLPTAWVFMDQMPLSPNGKVDRGALPMPGRTRPQLSQPYVAPADELEIIIANLWQDTINIDQVGVNDRFFELGGTSINAIQFISDLLNC